MQQDVVTIEVGSTITKVNAFTLADGAFTHTAQGFAPTSVAQGDVGIGVHAALAEAKIYPSQGEVFVNSSAAGGLRMTCHGLTQSMTARAAREASLGAGALVKMVTAGSLSDDDLEEISEINPNIVLLAGGVDFGEKTVVTRNAAKLAQLHLNDGFADVPFIYAGNCALRRQIQRTFSEAGLEIMIADNVFPDVDQLNVEPLRILIHEVFNRHIIHANGMAALADLTNHGILPTPGAVLKGAELFAEAMGDVLVFDVGGATTDIHSVTDGSLEYAKIQVDPEPRAKRTVEGDLGVYVNAHNIVDAFGDDEWTERLADLRAMPNTEQQQQLTRWLCERAVEQGVRRHAGALVDIYTPTGKKQIVRGKDLTAVQWVIATGGALTRVPGGADILKNVATGAGKYLLPDASAKVLIDTDYRFSALGTLAQSYPDEVRETFRRWATTA
ncbi:MAG: glutamate mutase L [Propionibacteriaceae bacterium]